MNQFGNDKEDKAKAAAGILLTAPGIPFIYYGEEIGMSGTKPDELIRTPMQWTGAEGAGFTEGTPWEEVNSDFTTINVAAQTDDSTSLLEHYRRLIQLRNAHPALRIGKTYIAESKSNKLLAYLRANEEETLLVVINISDKPVKDYQLELGRGPLSGNYAAASLLDDAPINPLQANGSGGFEAYTPLAEIPPYSVIVIQLTPQK
jgi:glycosidase